MSVFALQGELESQKEAQLKQVRGLATTGFKSDEALFEAMARASLALCRTYTALFRAGQEAQVSRQRESFDGQARACSGHVCSLAVASSFAQVWQSLSQPFGSERFHHLTPRLTTHK